MDAMPPPLEKTYSTIEKLKGDVQVWTFKYEYVSGVITPCGSRVDHGRIP